MGGHRLQDRAQLGDLIGARGRTAGRLAAGVVDPGPTDGATRVAKTGTVRTDHDHGPDHTDRGRHVGGPAPGAGPGCRGGAGQRPGRSRRSVGGTVTSSSSSPPSTAMIQPSTCRPPSSTPRVNTVSMITAAMFAARYCTVRYIPRAVPTWRVPVTALTMFW